MQPKCATNLKKTIQCWEAQKHGEIIVLIFIVFYTQMKMNYYIRDSEGLIRSITGTLVQGSIANSVTTAVTKSGGVTSYAKLSGVREEYDRH